MEGSRPGVMLYFETLQAIEELEAEDAKQIMSAILHYSRDGEPPALQGTLAAVWSLIRSGLDRDRSRYGEKQARGLWLTYCRKCKNSGEAPLSFEDWASSQHDNDTLPYVERVVNEAVNRAGAYCRFSIFNRRKKWTVCQHRCLGSRLRRTPSADISHGEETWIYRSNYAVQWANKT